MLNNQKLTPAAQIALLMVFTGGCIVLLSVITGLISTYVMHIPTKDLPTEIFKPENLQFTRLMQVFSSFLLWGVPALAVAAVSGKDPARQLGCNELLSGKQTFFVVLIVVASIALNGALAEINKSIPVSKDMTDFFQKLEENYDKQVMSVANMKTTNDYIFSLMILAIVPALFEEFFFRGCLQQIMVSLTKNAFAGIFITSFIFSAIHFSFYGFLPRLALGMMLGYIFYFSKNLWLAIIAHFINNAFSVTALYNLSKSGKLNAESMDDTYPLYYGVVAAAAIIFLFIVYKRESDRLLLHKQEQ